MADNISDNTITAKLVADVASFITNMTSAGTTLKDSVEKITSQFASLSSAATSASKQITSQLATLKGSFSAVGASSAQMNAQTVQAIQQMSSQMQTSLGQITSQLAAIRGASNQTSIATVQMANSMNTAIASTPPVLNAAAQAQRGHATAVGGSSVAMREFMVAIREMSRGDLTRLPGSLSILAQQFDVTRGAIEALFSPIGILAGAWAGLVYIQNQLAKSQVEVTNALQLSGNMAGLTNKSFDDLTIKVATFGRVSNSQARTALLELTKQGFLSKQGLEDTAEAAIMLGRKTGKGTEEALKEFIKMKDGTVSAAIDMVNNGHKVLESAQINEIRTLEIQGDKMGAANLLAKDAKEALSKMGDQTTEASKGWQNLAISISNAATELIRWTAAGDKTSDTSELDHIKTVKEQIKAIKDYQSGKGGIFGNLFDSTQLKSLEAELDTFNKKEKTQQEDAVKLAQKTAKDKQDILDRADDEHYKKNTELLNEELKSKNAKFDREIELDKQRAKDAGKSQQEITQIVLADEQRRQEQLLQIHKRYDPLKPKKEKGASTTYQQFNERLEARKTAHEKELAEDHKFYSEEQKLQDEINFLFANKNNPGLTGSNKVDIQRRIDADLGKLSQDRLKREKANYQEELSEDQKSLAEKISIANKIADMDFDPKKDQSHQSEKYYADLKAIGSYEKQQTAERMQEQQDLYKEYVTTELEKIDTVKASLKIQLEQHEINSGAYLTLMNNEAKKELEIKRKLIADEMALEVSKGQGADVKKEDTLRAQDLAADRAYNKQIVTNAIDAAKQQQKPWDDAFKALDSSFGSHIDKMIKKQETLGQAFRYTLGDMVLYGAKETEKLALTWIKNKAKELLFSRTTEAAKTANLKTQDGIRLATENASSTQSMGIIGTIKDFFFGAEAAKTAIKVSSGAEQAAADATTSTDSIIATKAQAAMTIPAEAAMAAGGAASSVASIPYVGPALAVAAYAETMAMVMGGLGVASASGGYDIPSGVNPLTQLHQNEMVLPAPIANTVRNAMGDKSSANNKGAGNTHIHMNIHTPNADSFRKSATQIQRETKRKMATVG